MDWRAIKTELGFLLGIVFRLGVNRIMSYLCQHMILLIVLMTLIQMIHMNIKFVTIEIIETLRIFINIKCKIVSIKKQ